MTSAAMLTPAPWNPRTIKDSRFQQLCRSLQADPDFLWRRPILATADGTVYAGNMRLRAALNLGWREVPAIVEDVPEALAKERAIRDNNSFGDWQEQELSEILESLGQSGVDLSTLGFDASILEGLTGGPSSVPDDPGAQMDRAEELRAIWKTERGQLWVIPSLTTPGREHRLLCGDSTSAEDVGRLMGGEKAALLLTDPPYNVGLDYGEETDDQRDDFDEWSRSWFTVGQTHAERSIVTPGCVNLVEWLRWFEPRHVGCWFKGAGATTHGRVTQYWAWEPIMFHGEGWQRDRHIDVFEYPGGGTSLDHPCPKPIGLWVDLIENYAPSGATVLDQFTGSGTTPTACEQSGRISYGLEISPAFTAVVLQRLSDMGLMPRLDGLDT